MLAAGHVIAGLVGFGFASFAICWAWINFSWFSSAYDTDDWLFRIVTMVQMIGVLVLGARSAAHVRLHRAQVRTSTIPSWCSAT